MRPWPWFGRRRREAPNRTLCSPLRPAPRPQPHRAPCAPLIPLPLHSRALGLASLPYAQTSPHHSNKQQAPRRQVTLRSTRLLLSSQIAAPTPSSADHGPSCSSSRSRVSFRSVPPQTASPPHAPTCLAAACPTIALCRCCAAALSSIGRCFNEGISICRPDSPMALASDSRQLQHEAHHTCGTSIAAPARYRRLLHHSITPPSSPLSRYLVGRAFPLSLPPDMDTARTLVCESPVTPRSIVHGVDFLRYTGSTFCSTQDRLSAVHRVNFLQYTVSTFCST